MSEVKTFDVDGTEFEVWENTSGNGEYVLYEDYTVLKAERDALASNEGYKQAFYEIADILGIGARPDSPKDVFEQVIKPMLINLEKERGQLIAENLALESAIECHMAGFSVCEACGEDNTCGNDDVGIVLKETPATDAYLNSVRNELVDEAIHALAASGAQSFGDCMVALNQLRAGEPS